MEVKITSDELAETLNKLMEDYTGTVTEIVNTQPQCGQSNASNTLGSFVKVPKAATFSVAKYLFSFINLNLFPHILHFILLLSYSLISSQFFA